MNSRERVQQLQREIIELSEASENYHEQPSHTPQENYAHQVGVQRLEQIIDQLMRLANPQPKQGWAWCLWVV